MNSNDKVKISVEDISKSYKMYNSPTDRMKEGLSLKGKVYHTEFWALSNITFNVKEGEILGIMGRNGAGKSTLLKIITGVLQPTYGKSVVKGRISSLLELGAGFNYEYSGIENIYFYGMLMKLTKKEIDDKIDDIIQFAEIGDYVHQPIKTYSSGMFARLAFSCAINVEPDILIVDEILSVGDMRFQAKCFNKFKEFKKRGVTILYVGHDVSLMKTFCDSAMWLNNGKIVLTGDPSYVAAKYTEFMYVDEINEFTSYKKYSSEVIEESKVIIESNEIKIEPEKITHWGTNIGMIGNVSLTDENDEEQIFYTPSDKLKIKININEINKIDYKNFSVAISIKNKEGTDLIVKTTYDEHYEFSEKDINKEVTFLLETYLASGEYYLVVALEDRKNAAIVYYEYIEGAKYFKIFSEKRVFGIYDPKAEIKIV